jgi:hypothetical protein
LPTPLHYANYIIESPSPVTGGPVTIGCVWNDDAKECFEIIQQAIDDPDTVDGHNIMVCPGTYMENVNVTKSLTIKSYKGPDVPIVQAANSSDNVFHVMKDNTTIDGFTIVGASGGDKAGIYLHGSTVKSCGIYVN